MSMPALKIEPVFLLIAVKALKFAWRLANKFHISLYLDFVHSVMASRVMAMERQSFVS